MGFIKNGKVKNKTHLRCILVESFTKSLITLTIVIFYLPKIEPKNKLLVMFEN